MGLKTADGNHLASGFQLLTKSHAYKRQHLSDGKCKFIENYSRLPPKDDIVDIFIIDSKTQFEVKFLLMS